MSLEVDPSAVKAYADSCRQVATEVLDDSQPDPATLAAMETGCGAVGADFTAAFAQFQAAAQAAGTQVAGGYEQHADAAQTAAERYESDDRAGAEGVAGVGTETAGDSSAIRTVGAFDGPGGYEDPDWANFNEGLPVVPLGPEEVAPGVPAAIPGVPRKL